MCLGGYQRCQEDPEEKKKTSGLQSLKLVILKKSLIIPQFNVIVMHNFVESDLVVPRIIHQPLQGHAEPEQRHIFLKSLFSVGGVSLIHFNAALQHLFLTPFTLDFN